MEFQNDKLCLILLDTKIGIGCSLSSKEKKHWYFLKHIKSLNMEGELEKLHDILISKRYIVRPKDSAKEGLFVTIYPNKNIDKGIAHYMEHSELNKIKLESKNFLQRNWQWILPTLGLVLTIIKLVVDNYNPNN